MRLDLEIEMDNAAFQDDPGGVTADLLRKVAARIADGYTEGPIVDPNDNAVGSYDITDQ